MINIETIPNINPKLSENLNQKLFSALTIIKQFYTMNEGRVHISFSGGLDSTVLLHIARKIYPNIKAVHLDTMQEYKGVQEQVRRISNVVIIKPQKTFTQIVNEDGYPIFSKRISRMMNDIQNPTEGNKQSRELYTKHKYIGRDGKERYNNFFLSEKYKYFLDEHIPVSHRCCIFTKEKPLKKYAKDNKEGSIIGMLAEEGMLRTRYINQGCINTKKNTCNPFKDWNKQDILEYAYTYKLRIADEYGVIKYDEENNRYYTTKLNRTGCCACLMGIKNKQDAIQRMDILKELDEKRYNAFMEGGKYDENGYLRPHNGFGYKKIIDSIKE